MNIKKKVKKPKSKLYCSNCGKFNHAYKNCRDPITSFGVINFLISTDDSNILNRISDELSISDSEDNTKLIKYNINLDDVGIKFESPDDIKTFGTYSNNIKFLMVRRKYTLGYIEFIRGRYNVDNVDGIIFLFRQMTETEIKKIGSHKFEYLWNDLWHSNKNKNNYQNEYTSSKNKFDKLKNIEDEHCLNLQFYIDNVSPTWDNAEWGFPKGRRMAQESDITCAIREFQEETGFKDGEYIVLDKLCPIEENLIGTNGVHYKHIYYPTLSNTDRIPTMANISEDHLDEIGDIGWFTYDQAMNLIRPYHIDRRKILSHMYMYIINTILNINKNKKILC